MQAERVRLQRLAQRLLEGLLLELQHQPVGLLPLGFPLLGRLPPDNIYMQKTKRTKLQLTDTFFKSSFL